MKTHVRITIMEYYEHGQCHIVAPQISSIGCSRYRILAERNFKETLQDFESPVKKEDMRRIGWKFWLGIIPIKPRLSNSIQEMGYKKGQLNRIGRRTIPIELA